MWGEERVKKEEGERKLGERGSKGREAKEIEGEGDWRTRGEIRGEKREKRKIVGRNE